MAPKRSKPSSSKTIEEQFSCSNFVTGHRVVVNDLRANSTGCLVVDLLSNSRLLPICSFELPFFSCKLTNEFYEVMEPHEKKMRMAGTIRGKKVVLSPARIATVFEGLGNSDNGVTKLSKQEETKAWKIMRGQDTREKAKKLFRNLFRPKFYLLIDIIDNCLMCKSGSKDKLIDSQVMWMSAILMNTDF